MRGWTYLFGILAAFGIIALLVTDNRNDGETVAPQADNTTSELAAGSLEAAVWTLSPTSSIQLLVQGGALPEAATAPLNAASEQYQEALSLPPVEAATLFEQSIASLDEAKSIVEDAALDASNQASQESLKRSAAAIGVIQDRIESDLQLVQQTGSPVPSVESEGEEK